MNKVFTIAEVGQAHDGSLGILHSYIDAVAETGVDAIKFQTHIAEAESSEFEKFRVNFSYVDKTRQDYWARMSFTKEQWKGIKQHCDDVGLEFVSSPFSISAVELLEELGVQKYKFGSGEISNMLMLEKVCKTGKDIILSSGMSCFNELDRAVSFVQEHGNKLTLLQCTTRYPTQPEDVGLNVISEMKQRYGVDVGLSDHSGTIFPALAAVSLGASMLEAHVVFDKRMFGPDSTSSLTIDEFEMLMQGVRDISKMLSNPIDKNDISEKQELKKMFGKSLAVRKALPEGHVLTIDDLETKKPAGYGISASDFKTVLGKVLNKNMNQWAFLTKDDVI
ncbi:N-acetylneuraminate synthase [Pseudoalteromonas sp. JBTF-M23]|uniref:N-acetylneuraminate synthase n=1 Tax=Pseudoalteromonas caenipelagi TaxID=2726988 RepID=A0A849VJF6_9GAMM|nr:N-acetylneuraminate synthase family protein [Pseudoalteromonas caenipelagi]NOU51767.1 N-acetylneuraminate synthase [Pseudoalteromonas caenipelagi]